jgi:hypothetical protein
MECFFALIHHQSESNHAYTLEEKKINLVYLIDKLGKDAEKLSETKEEHQEISDYFSSGNYFTKLQFLYGSTSQKNGFGNPLGQTGTPNLSDIEEFKVEIEKIIRRIMKLTQMKSETHQSEEKENMQISICYLLGFIEEEICPGANLIHEL